MITSAHNPKIQAIRALLRQPKQRQEENSLVIEGIRLSEEAINSNWPVQQVFYSSDISRRGNLIIQKLSNLGTPLEEISPALMKSLSETESTQGILMVISMRNQPIPHEITLALIIDTLRDPGNLGTILRTAWAAKADCVFLTPTTTDPFSPKVLRSAMGAHFHLPIISLDLPDIKVLLKERPQPINIFLADLQSNTSIWETDLSQPCTILVGSEAEGPSQDAFNVADKIIHIPMPGKSESLNAAAAAAILLFEAVRQRQNSRTS
jgi:TrmH family RNA methyltransferase